MSDRLTADYLDVIDRLTRERDLAREEVRIREQSQIPVIPRGAQEKIARLEARLSALETAIRGVFATGPGTDERREAIYKLEDALAGRADTEEGER